MRKYKVGGTYFNGFRLLKVFRNGSDVRTGEWECAHCGNPFERSFSSMKRAETKGTTLSSCGCMIRLALVNQGNYTHKLSHTPEFKRWSYMKKRCLRPSHPFYHHYGGRGIRIYDGWVKDFKAYYDYVTSLPSYPEDITDYDIHRIDNDGDYEPGNIGWVLRSEHMKYAKYTSKNRK